MRLALRTSRHCLLVALLTSPVAALAADDPERRDAPFVVAQATSQAIAEYKKKLAEYTAARAAFDAKAVPYWDQISEKRRGRIAKRRNNETITIDDYVLTQPPIYSGPSRPVDPQKLDAPPRRSIPVVADFLQAAKEYFAFVPDRPKNEIDFKRAYAKIALPAGLTAEQAVRIFGFEAGGNGTHATQAGLEVARLGARAISTALGYNQLLTANTIDILADDGDKFVTALKTKAAALSGAQKQTLEKKVESLRRMIAHARSVPYAWGEHVKLGETPKGYALHALNLDIDVGPYLQTQKLVDSLVHARKRGFARPLTAAELEMMNLTGDGNGFDMVTMPEAMRDKVPTSNFFQRGGYERNPVAIRNNTVAKLLAATDAVMDRELKQAGSRELAGVFQR